MFDFVERERASLFLATNVGLECMIGTTMQFFHNCKCNAFGDLAQGRVVEMDVAVGGGGAAVSERRHIGIKDGFTIEIRAAGLSQPSPKPVDPSRHIR